MMNKTLAALLAVAVSGAAWAADYQIDAEHANARFAIDHFNTSSNIGGFYGLEGRLQFDRSRQTGAIDITIPLSKLHSGSEKFTAHLKSADLFDAERFPTMKFVSSRFHFDGDKVSAVDGLLTLRGQTHPVRLKAEKFNCYNSFMLKTEVCGGDFSATIDRTQWGMDYLVNAGMTKEVRLDIQIEAAKQ